MKDNHNKLSLLSINLHWITALLIITLLILGVIMTDMDNSPLKFQLIGIHKSLGVLLIPFALWRIVWRMMNGFPKPVGAYAKWEHVLAKIVHYILILGTILLPISGIMMSVNGGYGVSFFSIDLIASNFVDGKAVPLNASLANLAGELHEIGAKLLFAGLLLHTAGALKHHFLDKDGTLRRIFGLSI